MKAHEVSVSDPRVFRMGFGYSRSPQRTEGALSSSFSNSFFKVAFFKLLTPSGVNWSNSCVRSAADFLFPPDGFGLLFCVCLRVLHFFYPPLRMPWPLTLFPPPTCNQEECPRLPGPGPPSANRPPPRAVCPPHPIPLYSLVSPLSLPLWGSRGSSGPLPRGGG